MRHHLEGSEVKSLRNFGGANIAESVSAVEVCDVGLVNSYVAPISRQDISHEERRRRKLLCPKNSVALWNETSTQGHERWCRWVMYFNPVAMAKIRIGIAKGKELHDKRETAAKRIGHGKNNGLLKDHG